MRDEAREHHLPVRRTARYYTRGEPGPALREVWLLCHGYGQLAARFLTKFGAIAEPKRLLVAPEALSRFYLDGSTGPHGAEARIGATWMTREDRLTEIDDYVHYLDRLHDHVFGQVAREHVKLVVLGFSQGVATVARWAARTQARIDRLVFWAGSFPPELQLGAETFHGTPLIFVLGDRDPYGGVQAVANLTRHFEKARLAFRLERFEGGHTVDDAVLVRLAGEVGSLE